MKIKFRWSEVPEPALVIGLLAISYRVLLSYSATVEVFQVTFLFAGIIAFMKPWPSLTKWLSPWLAYIGMVAPILWLLPHKDAIAVFAALLIYGANTYLCSRSASAAG